MTSVKEKKVDSNKMKAVTLWHFESSGHGYSPNWGLAVFFFSFLTKDRACLFKEGCCIEYRKGHFYILKRSWESLKDEWEQGQLPRQSTPVLIEIWFLKGRLEDDVKPTGHYCLYVCVWVNVSLYLAVCCNLLNVFHGRMFKFFHMLR